MAGQGPGILVVAGDWNERVRIAALLREAGFAVVASADERGAAAALDREAFAAAVIALPNGTGIGLVHRARRRRPELRALLIVDAAEIALADEGCASLVKRPFDPRQLLGCVFELVLREEAAPPSHAAELGIAAAKLACLYSRHAVAAAAGAQGLAAELTRQIRETRATQQGLARAAAL
jgi:DNA-binding response OmpR family regulator